MNRRHFVQTSVAAAVGCALPWSRLYALDQEASQAAGGIAAVKLDGSATVIEQAALKDLRASLRGPILLAGEPGYDQARRVLNESIDKHPALVVQPTGVADIQSAVNFARERELLLAVKCGGHSTSGKSTCEGGMQIDLSRFRNVRVDPLSRRAYAAGGSLLGELDHEAMAFGLVTTGGNRVAHRNRRPDAGRRIRTAWRGVSGSRSTTCGRSTSSPPMANDFMQAPTRIRNCSGECVAVAATSASSPVSSSACIRCSARSSAAT